jgi:hypothetical protein
MVKAEGAYDAAIIQGPTMPMALATTRCSLNNLPLIIVDSTTWESRDIEIVLAHEAVHAARAFAYRGGCWPYMYRIVRDRDFRAREQLIAYCAAGRFAVRRNRNPVAAWDLIVDSMAPDSVLTSKNNCLFEPWEN